MLIELKKKKDKNAILHINRSDGSSSWTKLHPGLVDHDLAHFAVEKHLNFKKAFYGLIDQGFNIQDFALAQEIKPDALKGNNLPLESIQTEYIVNLLQTEFRNEGKEIDFISTLRHTLELEGIEFPNQLDEIKLTAIRQTYHQTFEQWQNLPTGASLQLDLNWD